jgi:hypothetical protein
MLFKVTVVVGVPYEGQIVVEAPDATAARRRARELFSRGGFHPDTTFEEYGDERTIDAMNRLGWFEQASEALPLNEADEQAIAGGELFISTNRLISGCQRRKHGNHCSGG